MLANFNFQWRGRMRRGGTIDSSSEEGLASDLSICTSSTIRPCRREPVIKINLYSAFQMLRGPEMKVFLKDPF